MSQRLQKHQLRALMAGLPLPPPKPKRKNEEFQLQTALISWWHMACRGYKIPEFLLWHTPNSAVYAGSEEQREKTGAMLKRLGQRSGCPDLFLAVPRITAGWYVNDAKSVLGYVGLFLELKATKGVLSPEQTCFHAALREQGYKVIVARTLLEAMDAIKHYLT